MSKHHALPPPLPQAPRKQPLPLRSLGHMATLVHRTHVAPVDALLEQPLEQPRHLAHLPEHQQLLPVGLGALLPRPRCRREIRHKVRFWHSGIVASREGANFTKSADGCNQEYTPSCSAMGARTLSRNSPQECQPLDPTKRDNVTVLPVDSPRCSHSRRSRNDTAPLPGCTWILPSCASIIPLRNMLENSSPPERPPSIRPMPASGSLLATPHFQVWPRYRVCRFHRHSKTHLLSPDRRRAVGPHHRTRMFHRRSAVGSSQRNPLLPLARQCATRPPQPRRAAQRASIRCSWHRFRHSPPPVLRTFWRLVYFLGLNAHLQM